MGSKERRKKKIQVLDSSNYLKNGSGKKAKSCESL